jgi:hypothetical protein
LSEEFLTLRFPSHIGKSFKASFASGVSSSPADGTDMQTLMLAANSKLMSNRRLKESTAP